MVVAGAAHVVVLDRLGVVAGEPFAAEPVEALAQDAFDLPDPADADEHGARAGGFEALFAVALAAGRPTVEMVLSVGASGRGVGVRVVSRSGGVMAARWRGALPSNWNVPTSPLGIASPEPLTAPFAPSSR